jgi:hypothetical protein
MQELIEIEIGMQVFLLSCLEGGEVRRVIMYYCSLRTDTTYIKCRD